MPHSVAEVLIFPLVFELHNFSLFLSLEMVSVDVVSSVLLWDL